ncbi:MAG TPA: hypothetical protein VK177_14725 [Flavobacteriales bacterium]|nr:hypothetical protein [Flavobacteriales bacterium]
MSFFSKLFGGKKPQHPLNQNKETKEEREKRMAEYHRKEEERKAALEQNVKAYFIQNISKNGIFKFTIEAGNDEAFLHFEKPAEPTEQEEQEFWDMEEYLIDVLDIPSAGEFTMTGEGSLFIKENKVFVEYNTIYKEIVDYNEETEEEVYSEEYDESYETELFNL